MDTFHTTTQRQKIQHFGFLRLTLWDIFQGNNLQHWKSAFGSTVTETNTCVYWFQSISICKIPNLWAFVRSNEIMRFGYRLKCGFTVILIIKTKWNSLPLESLLLSLHPAMLQLWETFELFKLRTVDSMIMMEIAQNASTDLSLMMELAEQSVISAKLGTNHQETAPHAMMDGVLVKELAFWVEVNSQLNHQQNPQLSLPLSLLLNHQLEEIVISDK